MSRVSRPYQDYLLERLRDPAQAQAYLEVALEEFEEDGDREMFLLALRNVAEAQGGISELSRKANLNRQHLYRALSEKGNPTFETLTAVFRALGFQLGIKLRSVSNA